MYEEICVITTAIITINYIWNYIESILILYRNFKIRYKEHTSEIKKINLKPNLIKYVSDSNHNINIIIGKYLVIPNS